ncbi:MAG: hypothetical protein CEE40_10070 [Chloroflexi bacterium B3_Chlor]|nr:MAG: hypothetical protein CEE40_10070 [Chloroflexi bacterium B3_Chlor]
MTDLGLAAVPSTPLPQLWSREVFFFPSRIDGDYVAGCGPRRAPRVACNSVERVSRDVGAEMGIRVGILRYAAAQLLRMQFAPARWLLIRRQTSAIICEGALAFVPFFRGEGCQGRVSDEVALRPAKKGVVDHPHPSPPPLYRLGT